MRHFWWLTSLLLTITLDVRAHDIHDKDDSLAPVVPKLDLLDAGRAKLDLVLPNHAHLNLTVRGTPRGGRRSFPRSTLEARQDTPTCNQPGFVLTCPITERAPCCSSSTPVCCHDPSDTCCPQGYFCTGLTTCCLNGAVGCGEGCCPSNVACCNGSCCPNSSFTCGDVNGVSTCVSPSSTYLPSSSPGSGTTASGQAAGTGYPNSTGTSDPGTNNTPIIAGAVGGGVGAILLIGLIAWFFLRKKKSSASHKNLPANTEPTPFPPAAPPMSTATPPYTGNAPSMHKQNHSWSNSHTNATPFDPNSLYPVSNGSPPPLPPGAIILPTNDQPVGPGGYVPPPLEDSVAVSLSPAGTPYFTPPHGAATVGHSSYIGGGPSHANTSAYAPSRADTTSPDTTTYSASAPWASGVTHSNDQQTQATPWTAGVTPSPEQQNPVWAQPITSPSRMVALSPPPMGPMSPPPPPFSPAPPGFGGPPPPGDNGEGGRVIPASAPRDSKARPRNTGGG